MGWPPSSRHASFRKPDSRLAVQAVAGPQACCLERWCPVLRVGVWASHPAGHRADTGPEVDPVRDGVLWRHGRHVLPEVTAPSRGNILGESGAAAPTTSPTISAATPTTRLIIANPPPVMGGGSGTGHHLGPRPRLPVTHHRQSQPRRRALTEESGALLQGRRSRHARSLTDAWRLLTVHLASRLLLRVNRSWRWAGPGLHPPPGQTVVSTRSAGPSVCAEAARGWPLWRRRDHGQIPDVPTRRCVNIHAGRVHWLQLMLLLGSWGTACRGPGEPDHSAWPTATLVPTDISSRTQRPARATGCSGAAGRHGGGLSTSPARS